MNALVIDDNPLVCMSLERVLARRGITAVSAADGAKAMDEVRRAAYELVLLDIHLPDASGLDLLPEIRRSAPAAYVVVMSSDASDDDVERAIAGGALLFMDKCRGPSRLVERVLVAIGGEAPAAPAPGRERAIPGRTS